MSDATAKKKTSKAKVSPKKEKPKRSRPYNRYNIYFILERERLIRAKGGSTDWTKGADVGAKWSIKEGYDNLNLPPLPSRFAHIDNIPEGWCVADKIKKRRRHRKVHGMLPFRELAKSIADTWKAVDKETLNWCTEVEKILMQRHVKILEFEKILRKRNAQESNKQRNDALPLSDASDTNATKLTGPTPDLSTMAWTGHPPPSTTLGPKPQPQRNKHGESTPMAKKKTEKYAAFVGTATASCPISPITKSSKKERGESHNYVKPVEIVTTKVPAPNVLKKRKATNMKEIAAGASKRKKAIKEKYPPPSKMKKKQLHSSLWGKCHESQNAAIPLSSPMTIPIYKNSVAIGSKKKGTEPSNDESIRSTLTKMILGLNTNQKGALGSGIESTRDRNRQSPSKEYVNVGGLASNAIIANECSNGGEKSECLAASFLLTNLKESTAGGNESEPRVKCDRQSHECDTHATKVSTPDSCDDEVGLLVYRSSDAAQVRSENENAISQSHSSAHNDPPDGMAWNRSHNFISDDMAVLRRTNSNDQSLVTLETPLNANTAASSVASTESEEVVYRPHTSSSNIPNSLAASNMKQTVSLVSSTGKKNAESMPPVIHKGSLSQNSKLPNRPEIPKQVESHLKTASRLCHDPLSCSIIFFIFERENIIQSKSVVSERSSLKDAEESQSNDDASEKFNLPPLPKRFAHLQLSDTWYREWYLKTQYKSERKDYGAVGYAELVRRISQNWENVDRETYEWTLEVETILMEYSKKTANVDHLPMSPLITGVSNGEDLQSGEQMESLPSLNSHSSEAYGDQVIALPAIEKMTTTPTTAATLSKTANGSAEVDFDMLLMKCMKKIRQKVNMKVQQRLLNIASHEQQQAHPSRNSPSLALFGSEMNGESSIKASPSSTGERALEVQIIVDKL
eukprot:CAMPEP_0183716732 /NCGR_PEP_ID=MMETSP0737-20130205/10521_1 /TAXON_ID=385413 /ORGANISM="Thalassiosira miniscula, Strain CCMP1093" /LENGTH=911 /DNA_ID=CAMNT_0025946029 /DNA_START=163 /DNA_END=2895 /DNA_ORIENTATION=-